MRFEKYIKIYVIILMATKKIEINPLIFNKHKPRVKTLKNTKNNLIIQPNALQNKLINRVKEHKKNEIKQINKLNKLNNFQKNQNQKQNLISNPNLNLELNNNNNFINNTEKNTNKLPILPNNDFEESLNYLKKISENKKKENLKKNTTLKQYKYANQPIPPQLNNIQLNTPNKQQPSQIPKLNIPNPPPWGILKNGSKPTFRTWNKTLRKPLTNISTLYSEQEKTKKENQLKKIKESSTFKSQYITQNSQPTQIHTTPTQIPTTPTQIPTTSAQIPTTPTQIPTTSAQIPTTSAQIHTPSQLIQTKPKYCKKIIKKTKHNKFTLGKSKTHNKISILLKNTQTRKNVINAQKELKSQSIIEIKKYLKEHNLIKNNSVAPTDVLRKMYEDVFLIGDVKNINDNTLIHNFLTDDINNNNNK